MISTSFAVLFLSLQLSFHTSSCVNVFLPIHSFSSRLVICGLSLIRSYSAGQTER